ncbi:uncharacterized protein LOC116289893 [Actinia tenebrosa]|uniref:Uncharacterized protein LOC116289893 n=1 Tax=Actinia tenebrosa TaxID=6105 RepID=A0A6P8HC41_ACTTE|nr:uncharacterized protein LOC116289893 [Actinia tenebrosa]
MRFSVILFLSVVVPWCFVKAKKVPLPQECLQEYKKVVARYGSEEGHCLRLQLIVNCFSKRRHETGEVVDHMRYLFAQESLFVNKLGICNIDLDDLKEITDKTEVAQKHRYLDSVDDDKWDECAGKVHKVCIKQYLSLLAQERKVCNDAQAWIACYPEEAQKQGCDAEILQHFASMLKIVGESVVRSIRRYMGVECSKIEL